MLKATLNFNGQSKVVDIPTNWDEVNFETYCLMSVATDEADLYCAILDIDRDALLKSKIEGLEDIVSAIAFTMDFPTVLDFPTQCGDIKIPLDIKIESYGQFADFDAILKKNENPKDLTILSKYAAIYCQPIKYGGDYDYEKAMYLSEQLKKYPAMEVVSAGRFFLCKFLNLKLHLPMNYLLSATVPKRYRPDLKTSTIFSVLIQRSIRWLVMSTKMMRSWLGGRSISSTQS